MIRFLLLLLILSQADSMAIGLDGFAMSRHINRMFAPKRQSVAIAVPRQDVILDDVIDNIHPWEDLDGIIESVEADNRRPKLVHSGDGMRPMLWLI
ncbi:hypothetical protein QR680_010116 [Steinernema hermaphroditum]|nr:hypothetical protein QR680_010116 [Steinernema hermaphroditum]